MSHPATHTGPRSWPLRDTALVAWSASGTLLPCVGPNIGPVILGLAVVAPLLLTERAVFLDKVAQFSLAMKLLAVIVGYLCLNMFIAPLSDQAGQAIITIAIAGVACHICVSCFPGISGRDLRLMARGLMIGCVLVAAFLCIEYVSRMSMQRAIQEFAAAAQLRFVRIDAGTWQQPTYAYLTRNLIVLILVMWGALACARASSTPRVRQVIGPALFLMVGGAALASPSATAKAGVIAGLLSWLVARQMPKAAAALVYGAWMAASLLCIPFAQIIHRFRLYDLDWLHASFRHRLMIWSASSEWFWKNPLFGLGIGGARKVNLNDGLNLSTPGIEGEPLNWHAHNIFVQAWFEAGAIGGILLSLFGLVVLRAIFQLPTHVRAYAVATFMSIFAVGLTGFSLWAPWYLAGYGMAALCILVVVFTNTSEPPLPGRAAG